VRCDECGCVSMSGPGWVAFLAADADESEPPSVAIFCPPCAARHFGYEARVPYT
jgi:hypothetical protein